MNPAAEGDDRPAAARDGRAAPSLAASVAAQRLAGREVRVVPAGDDKAESLRLFAAVLGFPDYFGHNLDALVDSLGEFAKRLPGPTALIWSGARHLRSADPRAYAAIRAILDEAAARHTDLTAVTLDD